MTSSIVTFQKTACVFRNHIWLIEIRASYREIKEYVTVNHSCRPIVSRISVKVHRILSQFIALLQLNMKTLVAGNIWSWIISANNVARQQCSQQFIALNGTQAVIRTLLATHSKRDSNVSTELMLQDLVWILAALAPRGRDG